MSKYNLKWSFGNSKLKKTNTISFNIPALKSKDGFTTCPMAGKCASVCYAMQGMYKWKTTQAPREFNLKAIRANIKQFTQDAIRDLARIKQTSIRIHDSGDFFSQEYLDAWKAIANHFQDKEFYAYTKSLHLNFDKTPSNLKIIQSEGGKLDHQINYNLSHSKIFVSETDRLSAGYIDGNKDDSAAQNGEIKIGLTYHGSRKLTDNQIKAFEV